MHDAQKLSTCLLYHRLFFQSRQNPITTPITKQDIQHKLFPENISAKDIDNLWCFCIIIAVFSKTKPKVYYKVTHSSCLNLGVL